MKKVATVEQTRQAEKNIFKNGTTPYELMGVVGRLLAKNLAEYERILFLCGTGNNAGDGYAAASVLLDKNKEITLWIPFGKYSDSGIKYYQECVKKGVKCIYGYKDIDFSDYDLIVDCLYGIGFHGELNDEAKRLIERINASGKIVFSADVPSGLNADNGIASCAIVADRVFSVGFAKYGLYLNSGKDYAKETIILSLEFKGEAGTLLEPEDCSEFILPRKNDSHKGRYGYIALFGGSENYSGAIKLSNLATSAVYSGSGVVKLVVPDAIAHAVAPFMLESTLYSEKQFETAIKGTACIGVGCGWGRNADRKALLTALFEKADCPIVLDADGLFAWKQNGLPRNGNLLIITPHYAEMAMLAGVSIEEVRSEPLNIAIHFSLKNSCITVLKGPSTIVTDGKTIYVTNRGCAGMATAGSGDVFLGILTAIVGQKHDNLLKSVAFATILNGIAGEMAQKTFTDIGMTAKDTVDYIRPAIINLRESCRIV